MAISGWDKITYTILEDGTISLETEGVSGQNHVSADELLADLAKAVGGKHTVEHKPGHEHHKHTHTHGGTTHSHDHLHQ